MTPLALKAIVVALLLAALAIGIAVYTAHQRELGAANAVAAQNAKDLTASIANQAISAQRVASVQEKANAADQQASAARADAVSAHSSADRLLQRVAALQRASAAHPVASSASAPTDAADAVCADVLSRVVTAARLLGDAADQSRIAGLACQQSYDALIVPTP